MLLLLPNKYNCQSAIYIVDAHILWWLHLFSMLDNIDYDFLVTVDEKQ